MNTETKNKLKDVAADAAEDAAAWLKQEAKASTGAMRWLWGILALLAMGVVTWLSTGCTASISQSAAGDFSFRGVIVLPDSK